MIRGYCECRRVQFEVDGEIEDFSHCHCSQCRRLHGAAYATFAAVDRAQFRYLTGETGLKVYTSSEKNGRIFCSTCGSPILVETSTEPSRLYLSMSTIEGNPPHPRGYHAWVGSKAPWHEINDDLGQYEKATD
jgi:hypothetical protein